MPRRNAGLYFSSKLCILNSMKIFKIVDTFATKQTLFSWKQTIIIGLSGGPDSVFLLHYLIHTKETYNLNLIAAHLNHEWRDSAQKDADVCAELCASLNIPLVSKKISELGINIKPSGSREQDARRARQAFFTQLMQEHAADTVALAHHKDDQEETFFIRLFRGASLSGLVGMQPKNTPYIRPLLCIGKTDILAWLTEHNIGFAVDPTNESHDYLRNRIRHKLIPVLNEIDTRFTNSFTNTLERLQETERFLTRLTEQTFADIAGFDAPLNRYIIKKEVFLTLDPVMRYRLLIYWLALEKVPFPTTQAFLDEIVRFIEQPENKTHTIHHAWELVKKKDFFYLRKS